MKNKSTKRPRKKCKLCGKWFRPVQRQVYCGPHCRMVYSNRKYCNTLDVYDPKLGEKRPRKLTCQQCGKEFSHPTRVKYCSSYCRTKMSDLAGAANAMNRTNASPELHLANRLSRLKSSIQTGYRSYRGIECTLTSKELSLKWEEQEGRCAITGRQMTHVSGQGFVATNVSIDRIQNDGDYSINNVRLVCRLANHMRYTMCDEEFLSWCWDAINTLSTPTPPKPTKKAI